MYSYKNINIPIDPECAFYFIITVIANVVKFITYFHSSAKLFLLPQ